MSPPHRWLAALPAATVAAAATLLFSACSSSHPALQAPPRVNFGSASTTRG